MTRSASETHGILIVALAGAGCASGVFNMTCVITLPFEIAFPFYGSLTLALSLASVLWFLGIVHSRRTVAVFVAVTLALHVGCMFTMNIWSGRAATSC